MSQNKYNVQNVVFLQSIDISYIKSELYRLDLTNTAHRRLVCLTIIINPLYASVNSPLQVYETYFTDNIIYY